MVPKGEALAPELLAALLGWRSLDIQPRLHSLAAPVGVDFFIFGEKRHFLCHSGDKVFVYGGTAGLHLCPHTHLHVRVLQGQEGDEVVDEVSVYQSAAPQATCKTAVTVTWRAAALTGPFYPDHSTPSCLYPLEGFLSRVQQARCKDRLAAPANWLLERVSLRNGQPGQWVSVEL